MRTKLCDFINIKWCIDDVIWRGKDMDKKITKSQAREILSLLESEHDANIGINWETIDYWTDYYFEDLQKNKR